MSGPASEERLAELAANLAAVRASIADACSVAGRDPAEVRLIAVTKTFPVSDVMGLARLGVIDVGENKDQEAAPKVAACAAASLALRWHFVGQLQVNKAASVARYAYMVHSVDRARLATALGRRASEAGRVVRCLVQVSLDPEAGLGAAPALDSSGGRGGAAPDEVLDLAGQIEATEGLELAGVMAVAPLGLPARPAYARLREVAEAVRSEYPQAQVISAGMSADLRDAVREGATHVRIGTALLGGRRAFVR
ncbi:MAG TPA: YggS family pyridoxal phosphate-dependent enzyme [Streptosporangiaceae bacterium]|nr:YggS family pyridoxal phosphate-dependent enzyme [Streptosporangiaceae bacterium]